MTTIEVVCYKYKPLKNGELPLKIRVTKDRKVRYINLGVSTKPEHWDFKKNKPKANCPNRELLERLISNKVSVLRAEILELKSGNREYTAQSLIQRVSKDSRTTTISELFFEHLKFLQGCNRTGYYLSVRQTYNSLLNYGSTLELPFSLHPMGEVYN